MKITSKKVVKANKATELDKCYASDSIEAASTVPIEDYDYDVYFSDKGSGLSDDTISLGAIKEYWNENKDSDPVLIDYNSFEDWFKDTKDSYLENLAEVTSSTYIDVDGVLGDPGVEYSDADLEDLYNRLHDVDPVVAVYDNFEDWQKDTVRSLRSCNSSCATEPVEAGIFDFGAEAAAKYGDLISQELGGMTVSKRKDLANEPGGLIYEADRIGLGDYRDLLEALEGMCRDGRAAEIDPSTYKVFGPANVENTESIEAAIVSDDDYYDDMSDPDNYEFIDTKSVHDTDGFLTDYTMYRYIPEDSYVFVYGDRDLYRPEDGDFDYECDTYDEAIEWFNDYSTDWE